MQEYFLNYFVNYIAKIDKIVYTIYRIDFMQKYNIKGVEELWDFSEKRKKKKLKKKR